MVGEFGCRRHCLRATEVFPGGHGKRPCLGSRSTLFAGFGRNSGDPVLSHSDDLCIRTVPAPIAARRSNRYRQHPRDLFDVLKFYEQGDLTPDSLEAIVIYLAGHNRPTHEVLFGTDKDISASYANSFVGMIFEDSPSLEMLVDVRLGCALILFSA